MTSVSQSNALDNGTQDVPSWLKAALVAAVLAVGVACSSDDVSESITPTPAATLSTTPTPATTFIPISDELPVERGFAEANRARLYYEVYGEADPLLLIPGVSANHLSWADHAVTFSSEYRVIVYDPRGAGQGSPLVDDYSTFVVADDAAELIEALVDGNVHVYGASMGGMIAQELTLRHPDLVASLILGETTPGGRESLPAQNWALAVFFGASDPENLGRNVLDVLYSPAFQDENIDTIVDSLSLLGGYPRTAAEVIGAQVVALRSHEVYDRLPIIDVPTLVLHGSDDPLIPAQNAVILAEQIPGAQLILFEGARHSYRTEAPEADAAVLEFLAEQ